jgi:hypothetical protein
MPTQRHHRAGIVLTITAALVMVASLPAQASVKAGSRGTSTVMTHKQKVALYQMQVRLAHAAHRRALVKAAALRKSRAAAAAAAAAAARAKANNAAKPVVTVPVASVPTVAVAPVTPPVVTVPPAAAVPPVAAGSPSGEAAPRGNLPGWTQTYVEDFNTDVATGSFPGAYTDHWYAYSDGIKDTSKNGTYMPSKVLSVHDGVLDYSVRTEGGTHMVSAPVVKDTYGQVYGRYSVRFRSDNLPGYKNAWLLWPDSDRWPADGEIDFPEGDLNGTINAFSHYASAGGGQDQFGSGASFSAWHTATIEWVPGKVSFALDGKTLGSSTQNVPTTAMHWVLQTETALSGAAPAAGVAGHVLVDWVALYKRA